MRWHLLNNLLSLQYFWQYFCCLLLLGLTSTQSTWAHLPQPTARAVGQEDSLTLPSKWSYETLETTHFLIHYPKPFHPLYQKVAEIFEEAHAELSPLLRWEPRFKVPVLLTDHRDVLNGMALPFGRRGMVLQLTPPNNSSGLSRYDDWLRILIYHEYAHILNLDAYQGLFTFFRNFLFGDHTRPNALWPRWMVEGLATYIETQKSRGGRGGNTDFEMILRTAVEAKALDQADYLTLDRIHSGTPYAPKGNTPYLFGYYLWAEVVRDIKERKLTRPQDQMTQSKTADPVDKNDLLQKPEDILGVLSRRSAGRVPFFINGNLKNITGRDWHDYWESWLQRTRARMQKQLQRINSRPPSKITRLSPSSFQDGISVGASAVSPNGKWIAYQKSSNHRRSGLYLKELASGKEKRLMDASVGNSIVWTQDSEFILFSVFRRHQSSYLRSDLAAYHVESKNMSWLSEGRRFQDPDLSPDQKHLVFRFLRLGRSGLATAQLHREENRLKISKIKKLYLPPLLDQASQPRFWDNSSVVFTLHRNGRASEEILKTSFPPSSASPKLNTLVKNGHFNRQIQVHAQKIYFISDKTGVDNLYSWEPSGKTRMLTNLSTGMRLPSFHPRSQQVAYASVYSLGGYELAKISLSEVPAAAVSLQESEKHSVPQQKPHRPSKKKEKSAAAFQRSSYSAFPSLWPGRWTPFTQFLINQREVAFGLGILGIDSTRRHQYSLEGTYHLSTQTLNASAYYATSFLGPVLDFFYHQSVDSMIRTGGQVAQFDLEQLALISLRWTHRKTFSIYQPFLNVGFERELTFPGPGTQVSNKTAFVPYVSLGLNYSNAETSSLAVGSEAGRQLALLTRVYQHSGEQTYKGLVRWTEHLRLGKHFTLSPTVAGSVVHKDSSFGPANVNVESSTSSSAYNLDDINIRGYSGFFRSRLVGASQLELRFPLLNIYRGVGTLPFSLRRIYAFAFGEAVYFPRGILGNSLSIFARDGSLFTFSQDTDSHTLSSAGGGLVVEGRLLRQTLRLTLGYNNGFNLDLGGRSEAYVALLLPTLLLF